MSRLKHAEDRFRHDAPTPGRLPRRALIAAPQPFFSARGTPIATRYLIQALREMGSAVDVLTYPIGSDPGIDGVRLFRARNPFGYQCVPMGFSGRKVVLDVPFMASLRRLMRSGAYDLVHASEEAAFFLAQTTLTRRCAFVYDMQSSIADELARLNRPAGHVARFLERRVLERADMVVCSAGLGGTIAQHAPAVAHREWIFPAEPWPEVHPAEIACLRQSLGIAADAIVILYAGSFAGYQNTELMASAVPPTLAGSERVHFVFAGLADSAEEETFSGRLGSAAGSPRVSLVRRVPLGKLDPYKALADILLTCRSSVRNVPLKVFELLAGGKPIVANDVSAHRAVLDPSLAMLVPSTPEGFSAGILKLVHDPGLGRRLASNAKAFSTERLGWGNFRSLVADVYDRALARHFARDAVVDGGAPNEGSDARTVEASLR